LPFGFARKGFGQSSLTTPKKCSLIGGQTG
jgi:hypothetical protein